MAAGGSGGRPQAWDPGTGNHPSHARRDPNASSQLGGIFDGAVWG